MLVIKNIVQLFAIIVVAGLFVALVATLLSYLYLGIILHNPSRASAQEFALPITIIEGLVLIVLGIIGNTNKRYRFLLSAIITWFFILGIQMSTFGINLPNFLFSIITIVITSYLYVKVSDLIRCKIG